MDGNGEARLRVSAQKRAVSSHIQAGNPVSPLYTGDCIEVMRTMPSESVDAIVTDPPAGIAFMSKHWDRDKGGRTQWVAWMTEVMVECHRLLKPGGYAVVWSLPRTCHWTAWAMEDAGFIIRDQLAHLFASGFPKGRAQLKPAREDWWLARKPGPLLPLNIDACRIAWESPEKAEERAAYGEKYAGRKYGPEGDWPKIQGTQSPQGRWPSNVLLSDPELFDEPNPEVVGSGATSDNTTPHLLRRGQTTGKGIGLGSTAEGVDADIGYGDSGGYSRFFIVPKADRRDREPVLRGQLPATNAQRVESGHATWCEKCGLDRVNVTPQSACSCDEPQWSRIPKTARVNVHPTTKPTDLMRHLVRLVTPSGGTVLDPFLGSGTTAVACELEGFAWVGIEKEESYVEIANARLNGVQRGLGLDVPAPTSPYRPPKTMPPIRHDQTTQGHWEFYGPKEEDAA